MTPKLTKTSRAVKLLISKLRNGEITDHHTPAEVWKRDTLFQQYKLPTSRTRFHKIKKQVQEEDIGDADKVDGDGLNRRCTKTGDVSKKRRLIEEAIEASDEDDESDTNSVVEKDVLSNQHVFKPLHLVSDWKEPRTMNRRVSVAIALPSGVGVGDFTVRVVDKGMFIELAVRWPSALIQMNMLHKKWLLFSDRNDRIESYHPKITGFEEALMGLLKQASDNVESVARIALPFSVETHIAAKSNLAWKDSSVKIAYLDLKAAIESYAVSRDCDEFKLM